MTVHDTEQTYQHDDLETLRSEVQGMASLMRQLVNRVDAMSRSMQPTSDPASLAGLPCKRRVDRLIADLGRQKASQLFTRGAKRLAAERRRARLNGNGSAVVYDFTA